MKSCFFWLCFGHLSFEMCANLNDLFLQEKKQAMLLSIQNPQLMERLGLDLHDIRRRRAAEDEKSTVSFGLTLLQFDLLLSIKGYSLSL